MKNEQKKFSHVFCDSQVMTQTEPDTWVMAGGAMRMGRFNI